MTCPYQACSLSYVSLNSIRNHTKKCNGTAKLGDFVTCEHCGVRMKQFTSLVSHKAKWHNEHQQDNSLPGLKDNKPNSDFSAVVSESTPAKAQPTALRIYSQHKLSPIQRLSSTFESTPIKTDSEIQTAFNRTPNAGTVSQTTPTGGQTTASVSQSTGLPHTFRAINSKPSFSLNSSNITVRYFSFALKLKHLVLLFIQIMS